MLDEVHVRDLALIEDVWLEFGPGMTALTGETGAGKTVLLGALKLLLGERADPDTVRSGAEEAVVEGRFSFDGVESVVQRRVSARGRSRARLDGQMATVTELTERLGPLVDLHGQHEHQALLRPSTHVGYLDRWAGEMVADALGAYRAAHTAYREAVQSRTALAERLAEGERQADYLRFVADEIGRVDPIENEDEDLEARLPALRHAERLREASGSAGEALRGEGGAADQAAEALAILESLDGIDPKLDELADAVRGAQAALDDAGLALRAYRDSIPHDPELLDRTESRIAELSGLKKRYGPTLAEVMKARDEAERVLADAQAGDEAAAEAEERVRAREADLRSRAEALACAREDAVPGFVAAVSSAVRLLSMDGAGFEVAMVEVPFETWGCDGPHRIEILYSPAAGSTPRPLSKIASGGEISRVMLALKSAFGEADDVPLLVFDEVDAGIGGATASAVGEALAELARTHQVIVVTHLAQVAARAQTQLVVRKETEAGSVRTRVSRVEGEDRVREIARMLSGSDSTASLAHARELLDEVTDSVGPV